jgi:hypothetical protein
MNELILVDKMEKRLRQPQEPRVFPLTPTHRKELRQLRDRNIGELKNRLSNIKQMKKEEYARKYKRELELESKKYPLVCQELNSDWKKIIDKINKIISDRKNFEDKHKEIIAKLNLDCDWSEISRLKPTTLRRNYQVNISKVSKDLAKKEFEQKYGKSFEETNNKIDLLVTMYEEAINFGDLEIVKEIYYKLKEADKFIERVSQIKV